MKIGSLFSGIGGIEIGFEEAGFETEWFIEDEPYAQAVLKKRFRKAIIYGDITKIDFRTIPKVQILTGGFPCQDISNAGKRSGIEGSRSSLWKYYLKAISEIRPRFALIENVSALLGRGLSVVLCDLAKIGYDAEWYSVPASAVGANHQRDRIFIIAYPNSNGNRSDNTTDIREKEKIQDKDNESVVSEQCSEIDGSEDVSNTVFRRIQRHGESIGNTELSTTEFNKDNSKEESRGMDQGWWSVEPELGRVADGISNRVDRIRCIGNAVVPQVAEVFARAIKEQISING